MTVTSHFQMMAAGTSPLGNPNSQTFWAGLSGFGICIKIPFATRCQTGATMETEELPYRPVALANSSAQLRNRAILAVPSVIKRW
jgi:hypothetical protein